MSKHLGRVLLEVVAEPVGVIVHPPEQAGRRLVRVGAGRLPGLDPAAEELADELPEAAARVVDLLGLLVAAGEERLVEGDGSGRIAAGQLGDLGRDLIEVAHEREACAVRDEGSGVERQLDLVLDRICLGLCLRVICPFRNSVSAADADHINDNFFFFDLVDQSIA